MHILNRHTDNSEFPYFYLSTYAVFIKQTEKKEIFIFSDEAGNSMCYKKWKNKFLNLIQPIYPPLTKMAKRLTETDEKFFLEKFILYVKKNNMADRIIQPENFAIFTQAPVKTVFTEFATYFINLKENTEDQLFDNLHTKHRNVIRNAQKNGVVLKYGQEVIDDFYLLYKQTMKRSAIYCQAQTYFKSLSTALKKNCICGVAYMNEIPQGALFMPFTSFGAFYLYGASAEKMEVNGAMNYLHWNTMLLLKEKSVNRYDFVGARLSDVSGTKLQGIQQFKERFGATLEKGFLWKKDINKIKCNLFDGMVNVKLKLKNTTVPLDIIDQELEKVKPLKK